MQQREKSRPKVLYFGNKVGKIKTNAGSDAQMYPLEVCKVLFLGCPTKIGKPSSEAQYSATLFTNINDRNGKRGH